MVEVYDATARRVLERLLDWHPEWSDGLVPGVLSPEPYQESPPELRIASAHPSIRTPLRIKLWGTLEMYWHGGYFFDFIGEDRATEVLDFLRRFFNEEVRCGLCWRDGKVIAGGPVEDDE